MVDLLPPAETLLDGSEQLPFEPPGTESGERVKCRWCGVSYPLWKIVSHSSSLGKRLVDGYVLLRKHAEDEHRAEWAELQSAIQEYEREARLRGGIEGYVPAWYQLDNAA